MTYCLLLPFVLSIWGSINDFDRITNITFIFLSTSRPLLVDKIVVVFLKYFVCLPDIFLVYVAITLLCS